MQVKRLRAEFETAGLHPLPSLETADHHLLTATIKSYLRELPEPLLGPELYTEWLEAGRLDDNSERFDLVWNLLQHEALPRENYRNIQYLFRFLHEVSKLEERNKMSPSNLAIVITPNVVSSECPCLSLSDLLHLSRYGRRPSTTPWTSPPGPAWPAWWSRSSVSIPGSSRSVVLLY